MIRGFIQRVTGKSDEHELEGGSVAAVSTERPLKILLVDDEESFGRLAKRSLEAIGHYDVRTETRASNAVAAALEFKPDMVLLDVMMPDGDGGQVAASFQENRALQNIPLVFLTASVKRDDPTETMRMIGGRFYIPKPVKVADLIKCIEEMCAV